MKKQKEYFFSGNWESRVPAIFYCCLILGAWLFIMTKDSLEAALKVNIPLIGEILIWAGFSYVLFKICLAIAKYIMKKKEDKA